MTSILGQLFIGWYLADLLTGLFHWWEDEFGCEDWPIIGPWLITPNRLHHARPMAFAEHGFWGRNLASIIVVVFVGAAWMITFGPSAFMAAFLTGSALANEVHFLAHSPSSGNALTRVLQQTGVMQSPKSHALHHRPPHNRNYCVLTDWLNPFVEALR